MSFDTSEKLVCAVTEEYLRNNLQKKSRNSLVVSFTNPRPERWGFCAVSDKIVPSVGKGLKKAQLCFKNLRLEVLGMVLFHIRVWFPAIVAATWLWCDAEDLIPSTCAFPVLNSHSLNC